MPEDMEADDDAALVSQAEQAAAEAKHKEEQNEARQSRKLELGAKLTSILGVTDGESQFIAQIAVGELNERLEVCEALCNNIKVWQDDLLDDFFALRARVRGAEVAIDDTAKILLQFTTAVVPHKSCNLRLGDWSKKTSATVMASNRSLFSRAVVDWNNHRLLFISSAESYEESKSVVQAYFRKHPQAPYCPR